MPDPHGVDGEAERARGRGDVETHDIEAGDHFGIVLRQPSKDAADPGELLGVGVPVLTRRRHDMKVGVGIEAARPGAPPDRTAVGIDQVVAGDAEEPSREGVVVAGEVGDAGRGGAPGLVGEVIVVETGVVACSLRPQPHEEPTADPVVQLPPGVGVAVPGASDERLDDGLGRHTHSAHYAE
jgi:hypothetical protein